MRNKFTEKNQAGVRFSSYKLGWTTPVEVEGGDLYRRLVHGNGKQVTSYAAQERRG